MLECSTNKICCGSKTLSHSWRPYKLARSRSPCIRKSWRVPVIASRVVSTELIPSPLLPPPPRVLYVSREVLFSARKPYRHLSRLHWFNEIIMYHLLVNVRTSKERLQASQNIMTFSPSSKLRLACEQALLTSPSIRAFLRPRICFRPWVTLS